MGGRGCMYVGSVLGVTKSRLNVSRVARDGGNDSDISHYKTRFPERRVRGKL